MTTPFFSGDASIASRWLYGSATVLWVGDDIGAAFENRLMQALRVTPAGFCVQGARYSSISAPPWALVAYGSLGATALLGEQNYSPMATIEAVFTGSAVPVTGLAALLNSRVASDGADALLVAGRTGLTFGGADWLAGPAPRMRCINYRNNNSSNGIIRNYVRGSSSNTVAKGMGSFLNLQSATPAYLVDDIPLTAPSAGEDLYLEAQSFEGATPPNGKNYVLCCALVTSGGSGFTFVPLSVAGWSVLSWLDTTRISDAALAGVLPPLGVSDVVISIGQNNTGQTAAQFQASLMALAARFRAALPSAAITFLPTYDTNNAGSAAHLAGFADAHYAAQRQTERSCFLNLYKAAGPWAQNNGFGFFTDGVHPTESGKMYFLETLRSLLDGLIGGDPTGAASGRYADQADVERLFGRDNVAEWSQFNGSGVADALRVQAALDYADAAIDDEFREGPYATPLQAGASAATVTNWAATIAGAWLYRSRNASNSSSAAAAVTLTLVPGSPLGASISGATDLASRLLAEVQVQMARCRSGAIRLDALPSAATASDVPVVVG